MQLKTEKKLDDFKCEHMDVNVNFKITQVVWCVKWTFYQ